MSRSSTTALYTRVDNSFSNPVLGTTISPSDADTFFDDVEASMNSFIGTSTTGLAIGLGAKTFTLATPSTKVFLPNTYVHAFSLSNSANYMDGTVTSFDTGTGALVTSMVSTGGSGTIIDWVVITSGSRGAIGATAGFSYLWNTNTASSDPGTGQLKINNAAVASATSLYISETDHDGNAISPILATWDDGTSTIRGRLKLYNPTAPTNFAAYDITGTLTDGGTWDTFTVAYVTSGGSFASGDVLYALFVPKGDKGDTGATGATGAAGANGTNGGAITIPYTFSTTTADADPGAGVLRLDNATQNTATTIRADLLDNLGSDWTTVLDTLDASTSTVKGAIRLQKAGDPSKWLTFNVTARAAPSGYRNLTVANTGSSAASPFSNADSIVLLFTRNGDAGTGAVTSVGGLAGAVGVANGIEASGSSIQVTAARRTLPTIQRFLSSSGTYTLPTNCLHIEVEVLGGGGGGGAATANAGTAAGTTTFTKAATVTITIASPAVVSWTAHTLQVDDPVIFTTSGALPTGLTAGTTYYVISAGLAANAFEVSATRGGSAVNTSGSQSGTQTATFTLSGAGGAGGGVGGNAGGAGGAVIGGNIVGFPGNGGQGSFNIANAQNGTGGPGPWGGATLGTPATATPAAAAVNSGSGGGGAGSVAGAPGAGGGAGGYVKHRINSPAATYSYAIGALGAGGAAGTQAGGDGSSGIVIVTEFYGT